MRSNLLAVSLCCLVLFSANIARAEIAPDPVSDICLYPTWALDHSGPKSSEEIAQESAQYIDQIKALAKVKDFSELTSNTRFDSNASLDSIVGYLNRVAQQAGASGDRELTKKALGALANLCATDAKYGKAYNQDDCATFQKYAHAPKDYIVLIQKHVEKLGELH